MATGFFNVPEPVNEPVLSYAPGTKGREDLKQAIEVARSMEFPHRKRAVGSWLAEVVDRILED